MMKGVGLETAIWERKLIFFVQNYVLYHYFNLWYKNVEIVLYKVKHEYCFVQY